MAKTKLKTEKVLRGRRVVGRLVTAPGGERFYLAHRKSADLHRYQYKTNSDAARAGEGAWAIEEEILLKMRLDGVKYVGVLLRETMDIWLTTLENFMDRSKARPSPYLIRTPHLCLPLRYFGHRPGVVI
jgi:hypothetical protein